MGQAPGNTHAFPPGSLTRLDHVPAGRLKKQLSDLPLPAQERALGWLRSFHFTEQDLDDLHADGQGGIFYVCHMTLESPSPAGDIEPLAEAAAVPVSPFPVSLVFHSRPGAPNVLFLNFAGDSISNTEWNTTLARAVIPALPFSTDADAATFSDAEQAAIKNVWMRMAEDYAPFNVDVTTERPAAFGLRTAHVLITRNTDANGEVNPSSTAGGVAYVNVFNTGSYARYRPAWVYANNLANTESYIAEAASHEAGHNFGLSHDGKTDGTVYYGGHGSGDTSWGPIMGTGYNRNVSQWSKGEYYLANNLQDDLSVISGKLSYRADDHANTTSSATPLVLSGGTAIVSTTPLTDPAGAQTANKGVLERNTDVDVFSFNTGAGGVTLAVNPWIMPAGYRGGNLDVLLELVNAAGTLVAATNPASLTTAQIKATLPAGRYYLFVRNTGSGNPTNAAPTGYTAYASMGQYFITGSVASVAPTVALRVEVNNPVWGAVSLTNASCPSGTVVQVVASPAACYRFTDWSGCAGGTNPVLSVAVTSNTLVTARFGDILTASQAVPYAWLDGYGYTNYESDATATGLNGLPVWQSYVAGLDPSDPDSQYLIAGGAAPTGNGFTLTWVTIPDRLYTVLVSTNLAAGFVPLTGASNLPPSTTTFTDPGAGASRQRFYRVSVSLP